MRKLQMWLAGAALLATGLAGLATAQQADNPYIVFAKAGRVNYVAGAVTRQRVQDDARETLALRDNLEAGEVVRTGAYGRVEVLLNPGSYLRANAGSEFVLLNTELDYLQLRINKGSVLLEVMGPDKLQSYLTVETPQGLVTINKRGVYRLNVGAGGLLVVVQKGNALVGSTVVKGGNQLALGNGPATLAKFDKNTLDGFDNWSSERSATLAELNSRVSDYAVRNALANSSINNSYGRGQGLWIYDRYTGSYTFLPFGRSGWGSPYGWGYNNGVDYNGFMTYCDQRVTQPPAAVTSNVTLGRVVINNGDSGITRETAERSPGPKVTGSAGAPARDNENSRFGGKSLLIERDSGGFGRDRSSDTFGSNSSSGSSSNSSPSRSSSSDSGSSKPAPSPAPSSSGAEVDRSTGGSSRKVIDP